MSWQIKRDGFTAMWVQGRPSRPHKPYVRVTSPGHASKEYNVPDGGVHDGIDFMQRCITNTQAELGT